MGEREIVIRVRLPQSPRKRWLFVGGVTVFLFGAIVYAMVPNTFGPGDQVSSTKLMANFNALVDLTTAQTIGGKKTISSTLIVTRNGKAYSIGAVYCGNSPLAGTLPTTGYAPMKTLCETACSASPSAHMCTGDELVRSAAVGMTAPPAGWYSAGAYGSLGGGVLTNDCKGWTDNTSGFNGAYWGGYPTAVTCNSMNLPILCCD